MAFRYSYAADMSSARMMFCLRRLGRQLFNESNWRRSHMLSFKPARRRHWNFANQRAFK